MPTTENATLQRIQQEINESIQREKELRRCYSQINGTTNGNGDCEPKTVLQRAQSTSELSSTNGDRRPSNGFRRFVPNPQAKGVMQKFLKSRGKLSTLRSDPSSAPVSWTNGDVVEPPRVTVEPGKKIRNGYVPVEERMRKEVQDYQMRESELRSERKKSQPNLMALLDLEAESPKPERRAPAMRSAKSVTQLFDPDELPEDTASAPSSLRPARSLADLLDEPGESVEAPGTHSLILRFEKMKQKNGQYR